jgi:hypothetical protein
LPADPPRWVLTTQAKIDECADGLSALGFASTVHRPPNDGDDGRFVEFYKQPNGDAVKANFGRVVIVVFGAPQVITVQQYEESPFYEAP